MSTTSDSRAQIKWVTQNHKLTAYEDAKVSVMAPGLTFAALVFEGFRAYWNGEREELLIFRLDDHLKRLQFSMTLLELDAPPSSAALAEDILEEGMKVPIQLRKGDGRFVLVEGLHRLEACRALGDVKITCIFVAARKS